MHDQTDRFSLAPGPVKVLQARRVGKNDRIALSGEFERFQVFTNIIKSMEKSFGISNLDVTNKEKEYFKKISA